MAANVSVKQSAIEARADPLALKTFTVVLIYTAKYNIHVTLVSQGNEEWIKQWTS